MIKECPVCGTKFIWNKKGQRKYCSKECFRKERYKKHREYDKIWRERNRETIKIKNQKYHERRKKIEKIYRTKNREKINKYHKDWEKKLRLQIFELLGNKCIRCGEIDWRCLQIDHVNGGGCKERKEFKSGRGFHRRILNKIKAGSKDYQLLCANCNWRKKYENNESRK